MNDERAVLEANEVACKQRVANDWLSVSSARNVVRDLFASDRDVVPLDLEDLVLYRIEEITFEDEAPQLEALENALSCMVVPGMNLVYLITGSNKDRSVRFYFGFVKDRTAISSLSHDDIRDLGASFLKPALEVNFRGSVIRDVSDGETQAIYSRIQDAVCDKQSQGTCEILAGVPGRVQEKEAQGFRGIDRLVDVMQGDAFAFLLLAKPIERANVASLRRDVFLVRDLFATIKNISVQRNTSQARNYNETAGLGGSQSGGRSSHQDENVGIGGGSHRSVTDGSGTTGKHDSSHHDVSRSSDKTWQRGTSSGTAQHQDWSANWNESLSVGISATEGGSATVDLANSEAENWLKYFDEVLVPRLDYAYGKGAFVVSMALLGENRTVVQKLSNVARSIFSGESGNRVPLASHEPDAGERAHLAALSLPFAPLPESLERWVPCLRAKGAEYCAPAVLGRRTAPVLYSGTWMSVRDLALLASLPRKEVLGLRLKEEVEFGLNVPRPEHLRKDDREIPLGALVKGGTECPNATVPLMRSQLDRHVFVAGVTGSGKTTTCQTLLLSSGLPFLVIEPAKTEYRGLRQTQDRERRKGLCPELLVFTLGEEEEGAPFRLNPFELIPGESVSSRVDMLMASLTAAFDMEAAIPQLIERAIYACYKDCGWNIGSNLNTRYEDPFAPSAFAFPTLSDVLRKVETVVDEQGFDVRLRKDYIGSIKARLQGLTLGAKGYMLDCRRSVDFLDLLERQVVLELEAIPNAAQKAFVIGLVLTNLLQAVKTKFRRNKGKFYHVTLVEEAHRLLTKVEPGGNPARRQAAEMFADMLAEIRKYGESLVIADQIPGKLTPEVLKNTNTKIIHRLFAQDDKDAVGQTMGLEEEQKNFLSNLAPGRAVIFNGAWPKAVQVQIRQSFDTSGSAAENETEDLRRFALDFFAQNRQLVFAECRLIADYEQAGPERFPILRRMLERQTVDEVAAAVCRFPPYAGSRQYVLEFLRALRNAKGNKGLENCGEARIALSMVCNSH